MTKSAKFFAWMRGNLILLFIVAVILAAAVANGGGISKIFENSDREALLDAQITAEELKKTKLADERLFMNNEAYIKRVARERLRLVTDGEIVFVPRK
ncbi:hypothetical protein FACS189490_05330 [Clostridia bacterium]|nr:hypothetical protein FACS189490_05330 [Clostridia bacterium]